MACGVAISSLLGLAINWIKTLSLAMLPKWLEERVLGRKEEVSIPSLDRSGAANPVYHTVEQYLISILPPSIKDYYLESVEGELRLVPGDHTIVETVPKYGLKVGLSCVERQIEDQKMMISRMTFTFTSATSAASTSLEDRVRGVIKDAKKYVNSRNRTSISKSITVHELVSASGRVGSKSSKCRSECHWETRILKTNKSLSTLYLSRDVEKRLVGGVMEFLESEELYARKGIPYQWGCILGGEPGTGKTSFAKALAADKGLEIFLVSFGDNTFEASASQDDRMCRFDRLDEIGSMSNGMPHIVLFDDLYMDDIVRRQRRGCMDVCVPSFLRFLGGCEEGYGRIIIITTNELESFRECKALFRPGRLTIAISLEYCDGDQLLHIAANFGYPSIDVSGCDRKISPAVLIHALAKGIPFPAIIAGLRGADGAHIGSLDSLIITEPIDPTNPTTSISISTSTPTSTMQSEDWIQNRRRARHRKAVKPLTYEERLTRARSRFAQQVANLTAMEEVTQHKLDYTQKLYNMIESTAWLRDHGMDIEGAEVWKVGWPGIGWPRAGKPKSGGKEKEPESDDSSDSSEPLLSTPSPSTPSPSTSTTTTCYTPVDPNPPTPLPVGKVTSN
jgi:hypothetical protein